jgi:tRNA pseudouridine38-40 synthase
VHALGQVAHFDTPDSSRLTPADWHRALNAKLPPASRVMEITAAAPDFHSRFDATQKEYHYLIDTADVLSPLRHGLVWHLPRPLDEKLATEALRTFIGTHDFGNFAANRGDVVESDPRDPVHTTRTIMDIAVESPSPGQLEIRFRGSGFLYKMVRLLTGSAVQCALGKAELSWLVDTLENPGPETSKSHHLAPAGGLYLAGVTYGSKS